MTLTPVRISGETGLITLQAQNVHTEIFHKAREAVRKVAILLKSPKGFYTYNLDKYAIWNSAASGVELELIIEGLKQYSEVIPENIFKLIIDTYSNYGKVRLLKENNQMILSSNEDDLLKKYSTLDELISAMNLSEAIEGKISSNRFIIKEDYRGMIKRGLIESGLPVLDLAGYRQGAPLNIELLDVTKSGKPFSLYPFQEEAVKAFINVQRSGVIVLPSGSGKTEVGMGIMAQLGYWTLICVSDNIAANQWKERLLDKTNLKEEHVQIYKEQKDIWPVTIATYAMLTYGLGSGRTPHLEIFKEKEWGFVVYDEVHLLPANVYRHTTEIQGILRLGLTATLVREDKREPEIFSLVEGQAIEDMDSLIGKNRTKDQASLIGLTLYSQSWKELADEGYIAIGKCAEVLVPLDEQVKWEYLNSKQRMFTIASTNRKKLEAIDEILAHHENVNVLIVGTYLNQLYEVQSHLGYPLITGDTGYSERVRLYKEFRDGKIHRLIASSVANYAIDLPNANVLIEISGKGGSQQEEAQRLGRILRPNLDRGFSYFYVLVSEDTIEQPKSIGRRRYLEEQGYSYYSIDFWNFKPLPELVSEYEPDEYEAIAKRRESYAERFPPKEEQIPVEADYSDILTDMIERRPTKRKIQRKEKSKVPEPIVDIQVDAETESKDVKIVDAGIPMSDIPTPIDYSKLPDYKVGFNILAQKLEGFGLKGKQLEQMIIDNNIRYIRREELGFNQALISVNSLFKFYDTKLGKSQQESSIRDYLYNKLLEVARF